MQTHPQGLRRLGHGAGEHLRPGRIVLPCLLGRRAGLPARGLTRWATGRLVRCLTAGLATCLAAGLTGGCMVENFTAPRGFDASSSHLLVTSPRGGEVWFAGESYPVEWVSKGPAGDQVGIDLVRDGAVCVVLAAETANDGRFDWVCQPCSSDSVGYRIRVTDLTTGATAQSDQPFAVSVLDLVCEFEIGSPREDLIWTEGDTLSLRWWTVGGACSPALIVDLLYEDELVFAIDDAAPNTGVYDWPVVAAAGEGTGYALRLRDPETGSTAVTPEPLTFLKRIEPCELKLESPNGGEVLPSGDPVQIEWSTTGDCEGAIRLTLLSNGLPCQTIADGVPNSGFYEWIADGCGPEEEGYEIAIAHPVSGASDQSDGPFTITGDCVLGVDAPAAGETWIEGEDELILWDASEACGGSVTIDLLYAGAFCATVTAQTANDGAFEWTVAACAENGPGYSLRLTDSESGSWVTSSGFTIETPCEISLASPVGGEQWQEGAPYWIEWDADGACGPVVDLELVRGGGACLAITGGIPNSGSYLWTAERCGVAEAGYRLRVTDPASGAVAESPASFEILEPCELRLLSPAAGEVWVAGSDRRIEWNLRGHCEPTVRLELLRGAEVSLVIAEAASNTGTYAWRVRQPVAGSSGYRVRATSSGGASATGAAFVIERPCSVVLTSPRGGETWIAGSRVPIEWFADGLCGSAVRIELLRGGVPVHTISAGAENSGRHFWVAERFAGQSSGYTIRLTDLDSGATATTPAPFRIEGWVTVGVQVGSNGLSLQTNHPDWSGRLGIQLEGEIGPVIGCPAWVPCACPALLLQPGNEAGDGGWTLTDGTAGLRIDPRCYQVEVRVRGALEGSSPAARLTLTREVEPECASATGWSTACTTQSVYLAGECITMDEPLQMRTTFHDPLGGRLAVSRIEYIFHGWMAP